MKDADYRCGNCKRWYPFDEFDLESGLCDSCAKDEIGQGIKGLNPDDFGYLGKKD